MKECITLNSEEQRRLLVLNEIDRGQLSVVQGASVLGVSERQVRRMRAAYHKEGAASLVHGNRGRPPAHTLPAELREQVVGLARTRYRGCNDQHMSELLAEREEILVSRSTLRRWLRTAGLASPRKHRAPRHRSRRARMPRAGMLLQIDGSLHDWLEGRGPRLTLVGAIDDATGEVPAAHFRPHEDTLGYLQVFQDLLARKGVPLAIYRDRHTLFAPSTRDRWTLEEELHGAQRLTQLGRVFQELGIASIPAHSPQAKGRIERLWGTFQDRLVSELRLAGAATLAETEEVLQAYLPRFNTQFGVPPAQAGTAYRPLTPGLDLDTVCCFKYQRTVALDNTVTLGDHRLQLLPSARRQSYARAQVEVQERLDGSLAVYYQGQCVATKPAPATAPVLRARAAPEPSVSSAPLQEGQSARGQSARVVKPAASHPWRQYRTKSLNT